MANVHRFSLAICQITMRVFPFFSIFVGEIPIYHYIHYKIPMYHYEPV